MKTWEEDGSLQAKARVSGATDFTKLFDLRLPASRTGRRYISVI